MEATVKKVALLGLGTMGSGMASCLNKAGFDLTVWNRNTSRAAPFKAAGVHVAGSPGEAAGRAEVIIAMLADDNASRAVWLGDNGALDRAQPGSVLIECSTLSPGCVRELAERAAQRNCRFLDAPVTGSRPHAAAGELKFLVGGEASTLEQVRDVFSAMGKDIIHFGPIGSGAVMKLINNFMCGVQAAALAEAIALIEKSGLDREAALTILREGAPGSPLVKGVSARMVSRDYTVNFAIELMQKDLSYAIAEAKRHGLPLTTPDPARRLMEQAVSKGFARSDFAAVIEPLRSL